MSVVIEARAVVEAVLEGRATTTETSAVSENSGQLPVLARFPLRQAKQRWTSSLNHDDLQCLLQIIEVDLVPQLLSGFSPARCAPDDRLAGG